jgi:hypothetical protein
LSVIQPLRTNILRGALVVLIAAAALAGTAASASAKSGNPAPCWKVLINDWYDGRIDGTYPIHCYREALKHLPTDVKTYSSAYDDIKQALQERITQGSGSGAGKDNGGTSAPGGHSGGSNGNGPASPSSGGGKGPSSGSPSSSQSSSDSQSSSGSQKASGPIGKAFDATKPGSADSVPVPLIVLGAVALLLMAAGAAGFIARRTRTRKVQLASAATLPRRPGGPPPERS